MSKHTPGPWEATSTVGGKHAVLVPSDPGGMICRLQGPLFGPSSEVQKANAELIAAAPGMLAALKNSWRARISIASPFA